MAATTRTLLALPRDDSLSPRARTSGFHRSALTAAKYKAARIRPAPMRERRDQLFFPDSLGSGFSPQKATQAFASSQSSTTGISLRSMTAVRWPIPGMLMSKSALALRSSSVPKYRSTALSMALASSNNSLWVRSRLSRTVWGVDGERRAAPSRFFTALASPSSHSRCLRKLLSSCWASVGACVGLGRSLCPISASNRASTRSVFARFPCIRANMAVRAGLISV